MANENALKMCLQKRFPARRVLAFERCFAGRTLALSQVTDKAAYREGLPLNLDVSYVPFYDSDDHEGSIKKSCDILKKHLANHPGEFALMCIELVQGEAGMYPGHKDFFKALISILKENNISVMVDEIQSFGRTPSMFAYSYFGLDRDVDVVSFGKLSQVCATLFRENHKPKPGLVSQTFTSSTSAIRSSIWVFETLLRDNYYGSDGLIQKTHDKVKAKLNMLEKKHPGKIRGPFGIGAMMAFTVFDGDDKKTKKFIHNLFDKGLITFIAGHDPSRVRMLLPVSVLQDTDLDAIFTVVDETLQMGVD